MSETRSPPPADAESPRRRASDAEPPRRGRRRALLTLLIVALALAAAYALLESRREARLQSELAASRARELAAADARVQAAAQQAQEANRRVEELEQAAAEAADAAAPSPQAGSDEVLLTDVDRLVMLAMHDLQLTRQTATPLAALELADARLAAASAPRWAALRRALARDIERLRAVPGVDVTGIALKLDQLIAGADVWPMANTPAALAAPPPSKPAVRAAKKSEPPPEPAPPPPGTWQRVRAWLTAEFGDLIRIHEVSTPESLLLSGEQQKLARQQLKLRLLGARLALLARNDKLFHADIGNAETLLALYFDGRQAAVSAAAATLRQLNSTALSVDLPSLADSQAALRAVRARRR